MSEPLPLTNRCNRCGEWFHNAHACPASVQLRPAMSIKATQPTDAMVQAYLDAQRAAVEEADKFGRPNIGGLHTNTVREACRAGLRAAIAAKAEPAEAKTAAVDGMTDAKPAYLQEEDQHLLHRLIETTEDGEGYDIGKEAVKRLAELGVVQSVGFGRYCVTSFGYWVHEHFWHQKPSLPLMTNADRDKAQRAAIATQEGGR